MAHAREMLATSPRQPLFDRDALTRSIDACFDCAQVCTACADACLGEEMVAELRRCIRLDLDCADVCEVTGWALSRQTETDEQALRRLLEACADSCRACAEECERHAEMHEHCRVCADACRECEQSCRALPEAA